MFNTKYVFHTNMFDYSEKSHNSNFSTVSILEEKQRKMEDISYDNIQVVDSMPSS